MIDASDRELLERSLRHAHEHHTGSALDAALLEVGWRDALTVDARTAVSLQFELQGRANTTSSALDLVVAHALGIDEAPAVVLPALGSWAPPAHDAFVDGVGTGALTGHGQVLVAAAVGEKAVAGVMPVSDLTVRQVGGVDPDLGLVVVTGDIELVEPAPVDWTAAVAMAHLALAHELVGASRQMLDLARTHALERVQFGQPIAGFQAVRHRLADTLVAIEAAEALVDAAWLDRSPSPAAMAKAMAGRAARGAARHCQQVLAGIGFTTEHPFHQYLRRVLVLDELFGASRTLTKALGTELLATRRLPPVLPL